MLVWCLSPLGYASLTNNELELVLLNMPLSFALFFFNVVLKWLYILFIFLLSLLRCLIHLRFDFGLIDLFASREPRSGEFHLSLLGCCYKF